ncbi:flagellar hook assembly protein FlgD [Anaerospora sp.]|jgi:flagellar basal-body rod modification protein FlgD|uniref:flagellar hook assembly protein FlgD n=1 Tax=Anaerospora sp. TaxID=1960278 RepID=UPI00289BF264|nr:flagellar hook assembly protein FlgD [Anaerospora sp.]
MSTTVTNNEQTFRTATNTSSNKTTSKANDALGKDDFLKMLVTQLRYQDPLQPMEDKEFIAQMAQFSSLEQMQNMNTAMITTQATNLIGKEIHWMNDQGKEQTGVVTAVTTYEGVSKLIVGDTSVGMDKVFKVSIKA